MRWRQLQYLSFPGSDCYRDCTDALQAGGSPLLKPEFESPLLGNACWKLLVPLRQQLLHRIAPLAVLHLAKSLPHPCKVWPRMGKQLLTVIRHGKRLDEVEAFWRVTAERPWDPPLWTEGLVAVRVGAPLPHGGVDM